MFPHLFLRHRSGLLKRSPNVLAAIAFLMAPTILHCQQSDVSTPADSQTIRLLLERINQLEASQKQMSDRLAQLERAQPVGDPKPEARDENYRLIKLAVRLKLLLRSVLKPHLRRLSHSIRKNRQSPIRSARMR